MWMSQYVDVTVDVDVTVCGCHSMWMSQYVDGVIREAGIYYLLTGLGVM